MVKLILHQAIFTKALLALAAGILLFAPSALAECPPSTFIHSESCVSVDNDATFEVATGIRLFLKEGGSAKLQNGIHDASQRASKKQTPAVSAVMQAKEDVVAVVCNTHIPVAAFGIDILLLHHCLVI